MHDYIAVYYSATEDTWKFRQSNSKEELDAWLTDALTKDAHPHRVAGVARVVSKAVHRYQLETVSL